MFSFSDMFCYQCEQTKSRKGCVTVGVCGKSPQVAALQDLLLYVAQGLAVCANRAINMGVYASEETNDFILTAFFRYGRLQDVKCCKFPKYSDTQTISVIVVKF